MLGRPLDAPDTPTSSAVAQWLRRFWWSVPLALVVVATVVLVGEAAVYQPLVFGGGWGEGLPGVAGSGSARVVNNQYGAQGEYYVPPTTRTFVLSFSVTNDGPHAVTIEGASAVAPGQGASPWPVLPVGPALYLRNSRPPTVKPVKGFSIGPYSTIYIALRLTMASRCYVKDGWTSVDRVYLSTRYHLFTHEVALALPTSFIMHEPAPPGAEMTGVVCPAT
ncbi:MAG: hypothetical protein ACHQBP_05965 [Acidimicrobiales bacterium]